MFSSTCENDLCQERKTTAGMFLKHVSLIHSENRAAGFRNLTIDIRKRQAIVGQTSGSEHMRFIIVILYKAVSDGGGGSRGPYTPRNFFNI